MKKILAMLLVFVLLLGVLSGCTKKELAEEPVTKPTRVQIAGGQASIKLPEGFYADNSTALAANQIARYSSADSYTLEIFQLAKTNKDSLKSVADKLAGEKGVKAFQVNMNENLFMAYTYQQMGTNTVYTVANYVVAAKQSFLVFTFYVSGNAQTEAVGVFLEEVKLG